MYRVHAVSPRSHAPSARPARKPSAPVRDFRARGKLRLVTIEGDRCVLCEGTIDRFDGETFLITSRCQACHIAVETAS